MSKFESIQPRKRMAKYVFLEKFADDPRPGKILASTGAYKNESGEVPDFECVQIAMARVRSKKLSKAYLDIAGYPPFREAVTEFLFGSASPLLTQNRIITAHTPGGTPALRLGAELISLHWPETAIWVPDPTWGNHIKVFRTAGLTVRSYPYHDPIRKVFEIEPLLAALEKIPKGDVVFFQASTHNPTCLDPSPSDWEQIARLLVARQHLTFFDAAFFGFTNGIEEDLQGLRIVAARVGEALIAVSFSKSFALYNDRIGALSLVGFTAEATTNLYHHLRHRTRASYSNPPLSGAAVVAEILTDPALYEIWEREITGIRARTRKCREKLLSGLQTLGVNQDLSFLRREKGLFTSLGLSQEQIQELQEKHAVYIAQTGRINVTAMTDPELDRFCALVAGYLEG